VREFQSEFEGVNRVLIIVHAHLQVCLINVHFDASGFQ